MKRVSECRCQILVYASVTKSERGRYCRMTFNKPIKKSKDEFLYGRLRLNNKNDITALISTAESEFRNYPAIICALRELQEEGEFFSDATTADILLRHLFYSALSMNFPSYCPVVPFRFEWFTKRDSGETYPVKVSLSF